MPFVYLIKAYNDYGTRSIVVGHVEDRQKAIKLMQNISRIEAADDCINYEGPVLADRYPIGTIINEESEDE